MFGAEHARVLKKELDSEPVYNNKFLKSKIRPGKTFAYFHGKDAPVVGLNYICVPKILIDFVYPLKRKKMESITQKCF